MLTVENKEFQFVGVMGAIKLADELVKALPQLESTKEVFSLINQTPVVEGISFLENLEKVAQAIEEKVGKQNDYIEHLIVNVVGNALTLNSQELTNIMRLREFSQSEFIYLPKPTTSLDEMIKDMGEHSEYIAEKIRKRNRISVTAHDYLYNEDIKEEMGRSDYANNVDKINAILVLNLLTK